MKILLPIEGSETSQRALQYALKLAKQIPSLEVTLLSVVDQYVLPYASEGFVDFKKVEEQNKKLHQKYLQMLSDSQKQFQDAGLTASAKLLTGEPGHVIVSYLEEEGFDSIVMGSRGLSPLKGAILGSVAYKVLSSAKVPVTIVK